MRCYSIRFDCITRSSLMQIIIRYYALYKFSIFSTSHLYMIYSDLFLVNYGDDWVRYTMYRTYVSHPPSHGVSIHLLVLTSRDFPEYIMTFRAKQPTGIHLCLFVMQFTSLYPYFYFFQGILQYIVLWEISLQRCMKIPNTYIPTNLYVF